MKSPDVIIEIDMPQYSRDGRASIPIDLFADIGQAISKYLGKKTIISEPKQGTVGIRMEFWKDNPR